MNKKTKIIATIGPASESNEILKRLIEEGVDVFRFNLKHNTLDWHKETIKKVRKIADKMNKKIGIMIDLQGPEIRLETKNAAEIEVAAGESVFIANKFLKNRKTIKINPVLVLKQISKGDTIYIDDGEGEFKVMRKRLGIVKMKSERDYVIKNRKSMNIPGKKLEMPLFADNDKVALAMVNEFEADYAALSFVRSKEDVEILRKLLDKISPKIKIVAKIENASAIKNIEEIIEIADAIMVARGDLGIEIPIRELAFWQKTIIDLCRKNSKPVIVATQMLKSMVDNYRPTRAEATDVSNAVFDGTDAVMLSEETASGKYPVKVVEEMASIAEFTEENGSVRDVLIEPKDLVQVLVDAAVQITKDTEHLKIKAVIIFTQSGTTARVFSRYRVNIPVIAITNNIETVDNLSLSYGVDAYVKKTGNDSFKISTSLLNELLEFDFMNKGDIVLIIHGSNWIESGATSDISLLTL
jgi:pyruvate kinase